jgi:MerR family transcriptional regulator, mercuric resistance operon regulatory protein
VTATLRVGEVAAAAGVKIETVRYYERRGLLARPDRSLGGHRLYPAQTVERLRVIKVAQHLGFTLAEVSELLEAGHHHPGAARSGGLHDRARVKLAEVEQKITELIVIRDTLREAVAAGCDDLASCAANEACPLPFADLAATG